MQHQVIKNSEQKSSISAAGFAPESVEFLNKNIDKESHQFIPVQCKLSINPPDDPLEQDADAVADKVMSEPGKIQRLCTTCADEEKLQQKPEISYMQRKCAECDEESRIQPQKLSSNIPFLQAKINGLGTVNDEISRKISSTRGNGSSLDPAAKSFMENRFGTDFSGVKIHTGSYAVQMSQDLNAQAFTAGSDIYFNTGKYDTSSKSGMHLLAHELTHTIQQGNTNSDTAVQRVPFSPWPGQTGTDVAGTYSSVDGIIRERVQRTGDPNYAQPLPSLLEFDPANRTLRSTMQINFVNETNAANALTTEQFNELKARILRVGNERLNGWITIRAGNESACPANCRDQDISVQIIAEEGTGTYATTVMLGSSYDRENAGHIGRNSSDWTVWHEMGHIVLGAADEYADTGRPAERVNESDFSIMASSSSYGRVGMLHSRHFSHLAAWLTRKYPGCTFTTTENERPVVIDWTPELFLGGFGGPTGGIYYSLGFEMGIPLDRLRRVSFILGPRLNFIAQLPDTTMSLLAGLRAGFRFRTPGLESFRSSVFTEGGGVGFTDLSRGVFGAAPYAEGGTSLGFSYYPFNIGVEAAGGGRTATIPADPSIGAPVRTELQPYFRLGLSLSGTF